MLALYLPSQLASRKDLYNLFLKGESKERKGQFKNRKTVPEMKANVGIVLQYTTQ